MAMSSGPQFGEIFQWKDLGLDLRNGLQPELNQSGRYITDVFTKEAEKIILSHNQSQASLEHDHEPVNSIKISFFFSRYSCT